VRLPVVTAFIILVNVFVFLLELMRGDAFVMQWSAIPSQIISGHHWITIFTAVHARQLVAHHREYDFPLGLRP
jgi:membrane associated rhomboid family serine protease